MDRQGNHHYDREWKKQVVAVALEPGTSLSRVAIDHGINTNLVRKWVRKHKEAQMDTLQPSPPLGSAFIPVRVESAADDVVTRSDRPRALALKSRNSGEMRPTPAKIASFSSVARLTVSLPNGIKLSLECDDVRALTAVIGAVSDV
ncbi:IS66-like element accessory protein TnpA [Ochrobactrum quorumnocens]|uniref:IS66-like element accessory protein TnpA n=1 Tax=Ochrobactrum quorumnocens TaxID=271865 RepID=UPI000BA8C67A|nr:transposase [[Ochrobactrum] quorumnocens]